MTALSRLRARLAWLCAGLIMCVALPARGDDTADEADLKFQLGAEAYQRGDYREALQHFLASNRLVPNKNVVFNIARAYEKLKQYPEAYRYFTLALEGEKDNATRQRIQDALDQLKPNVAVIDVWTDPPGATIYIDRKDLGARGESPRKLGVDPGTYKVIVELKGYESAETSVKTTKAGQSTGVKLTLKQILGTVKVEGAAGSEVHVDEEGAPRICIAPCTFQTSPGPHTLYLGRPGFRTTAISVDVKPRQTVTVRPDIQALRGELVVSTDEPGALIEVDGRPVGFTPTIVPVAVGKHRVRVGLRGFRTIEREVVVKVNEQTRLDETLTQSQEVIAASRATQSVEDAPGSVSLIPQKELQVLAYPTIAEAVRGLRGVYTWDDRAYTSVGVRGLGRLGSYGNRVLVLIDGQPTNDNWIGSSYVGYDARTDLADIERIEFVRGPGSVLYGTNAFSGVINLVTRSRGVPSGGEAGISTNLDGVARGRARANANLGPDAGVWTSVGVARSSGRDFHFAEYEGSSPSDGDAVDVDKFEAGSFGGRAWWKWASLQWWYQTHDKQLPTGQYDTIVGDGHTHQRDTRLFVEGTLAPKVSKELALFTRAHWNHYRFFGQYAREEIDGGIETDTFRGSWVGLEQRLEISPVESFKLTVGGEGQLHYQVDQTASDEAGPFLEESGDNGRPYQVGAAYGSADVALGSAFRINAGARLDAYSTFGSSINPRIALLIRPYNDGNVKLIGGKAFRAPSVYELYYNDGGTTQIASPDLEPESIYSGEIEFTHRFSPTVTGTIATFANYVKNLIDVEGEGDETDPLHYVNTDTPVLSVGGEAEVRRDWRQGWMLGASYAYQRSTYLRGDSASDLFNLRSDPSRRRVANSPEHLASVKGAVPILGRNVTIGSRVTFEGPRYDRYESDDDPDQAHIKPFVIWDLVFSGYESHWGLRWAVGVYNAFDWRYSLPVSPEFRQRTISQNGRTLLASADVAF